MKETMTGGWFLALAFVGFSLRPAVADEMTTTNAQKTIWQRETLTGDWGDARTKLSEQGYDFGLEYTGEFLANTSGGERQAGLYQHTLKTLLDFDLEKMAGWKSARVHASSFWLWGTRPEDIAGLTGSGYSDPSNISGYDTYRLYELWLEQGFLDGRFSVRAGQIALDDEFICSDYACVFLSGTHGWPAFMSATIPGGGEAYPVAGTGARLDFKPTDKWELLAAVVDGDVRDQATDNQYGTHFGFKSKDGVLSIVELIFRFNQKPGDTGLPGTYKIGGWYHSARFNDLRLDTQGVSLQDPASNGMPASHAGDGGMYFNIDQMLWRKRAGADEGLGAYVRVAPWMPADRNPMDFYAAGGLRFKGLLPNRGADVLAVGADYAHVSSSLRDTQNDANRIAAAGGTPNSLTSGPVPDYELGLEATYQISLAPWWKLQPDFQYIFHPGGSMAIQDAVVVGLRTQISF
jgi:porin